MLLLLQLAKSLRSYLRTTMDRAQERKRAIRVNHLLKGQKTKSRVRIYAHSLEDNRE